MWSEAGIHYRRALLGNIFDMSARRAGWIIDISFFPDCPRRRRTLIPWERGETATEGVITHSLLPTTVAHKSPTINEPADAAVGELQ